MSSYLTSSTLIDSVKRRAAIPESQVTFLDDDLLAFANEEMMIGLVPSILKMHEEFYVYPFVVDMQPNVSSYEIPDRAMGNKVRTLFYRDASLNLQEMARVNPEDLVFYQNRSSINFPRAFYIENDYLNMIPIISDSPQGDLIMKIFLRPNQLVSATRVATVQSVDYNTGIVVVDQVPSVFSLNDKYDIVQESRGHRTKAIELAPVGMSSLLKTITFTLPPPPPVPNDSSIQDLSLFPLDLREGDLICLAGETTIPQMPDELHSILAQRVACRCLEAQKDTEGLQSANAKLQEMELNLGMLIDNRTEGQPQKVNNLRSALRAGKFRRRRSTY